MNLPNKELMLELLRKDRPYQTIKRVVNVKEHEMNSHSDVPVFSVLAVLELSVNGKLEDIEVELPYPLEAYKNINLKYYE